MLQVRLREEKREGEKEYYARLLKSYAKRTKERKRKKKGVSLDVSIQSVTSS